MGRDAGGGSDGKASYCLLNFPGRSFFTMPKNSHYSTLNQVAVARGLNNVDMLIEEVGVDACSDHVLSEHYRQQPRACRSLLNDYWDLMKSERAFDQGMARMSRRDLVKFCGFSDDSESLNRPPKPSST